MNIAKRIPQQVRSLKLMTDDDPIASAQNSQTDVHMQLLFAIWYEFIEPYARDGDIECGICRGRIIRSFRQMKPDLINMEADYLLSKQ